MSFESKKRLIQSKLPLICLSVWITLLTFIYTYLENKIEEEKKPLFKLQREYKQTLATKKERLAHLQEEVNSLSDPAAGEKALIEKLGVVPKGMQRVLFIPEEQNSSL